MALPGVPICPNLWPLDLWNHKGDYKRAAEGNNCDSVSQPCTGLDNTAKPGLGRATYSFLTKYKTRSKQLKCLSASQMVFLRNR